jgi:succinate dehydrogenase/fumarate reductase flavoprotein subunit
MATGGFSANSAMVVKYRPDLAGFVTTNHKGATGGIALLERIGAGTVDMGEIQIHPTVEQNTSYLISESIRGGGAILVNQQGNRFFNEMETRDKVSAAIIALPEHMRTSSLTNMCGRKTKRPMSTSPKASSPAPARRANWRRNWGWITMPSSPRWNATTALLKNSMMNSLAVPPRCARRLTKGRSMRSASRRGSPHHGRRDH